MYCHRYYHHHGSPTDQPKRQEFTATACRTTRVQALGTPGKRLDVPALLHASWQSIVTAAPLAAVLTSICTLQPYSCATLLAAI